VLCEQLERGQSNTPLADHILKITQDIHSAPLSIVLLGVTPDALQATLSWLYGDSFSVLSKEGGKLPGLMEITLSDKSYALQQGQKAEQFEQLVSFQQAMQIEMGATTSSSIDPLKLSVKNQRDIQGLRLLIPESVPSVLDAPGMLNALISEANVLMVTAPLRYTFSREDHDVVEELSRNMAGFWPLLMVDELNEEVTLPEIGWWEQHKNAEVLIEPKLLTSHVPPNLTAFLTEVDNEQRQAFFYQLQARRLAKSIDAIFSRYQQDAGLLQQRKDKIQQQHQSSPLLSPTDDRREWDKLRQAMDEAFLSARKEQEQAIQSFSLQGSGVSQAVKEYLEQLNFEDIDQELGHSTVKLSLKSSALSDLRQLVLKQSKLAIKKQHQQCESQMLAVQDLLNQQLQTMAVPVISSRQIPERYSLYDALDERLELNLNYRGEMPLRTTMTRLSESRKVIMGISVATMVLGGMGTALWGIDLRAAVMTIAPLLAVGGFAYTYVQWPKEDAEKMAKELDRVRDGLNSEIRRTLNEIQRFLQTLMNETQDKQKRSWQTELQDINHSHQEHQRSLQEEQKQEQQKKMQGIEQELRTWQNIERQLERLKFDTAELSRTLAN